MWFHSYVEFMKQQNEQRRKKERQTKKQNLIYGEQTDGYKGEVVGKMG